MPADQAIRPARERLARDSAPDLWGRSDAVFNAARTHRYYLSRRWAQGGRTLIALMLNPSKAGALENDNTVRRCVGFARREGCNALAVLNLYGLVSTDPAELYSHPDPVGARNDEFIDEHCQPGWLVLAAWGAHGALNDRGPLVAARLITAGVELSCFARTATGQPIHPLYQSRGAPLLPYVP
jgi:hypothetical protein